MNVARRLLLCCVCCLVTHHPCAQETRPQETTPQQPAPPPPPPAPGGQATPPPGAYTIQRTARLVILDAVVVDSKGNAVTGLTRDQFQIQEDGAPQTLLNFSSPGRFTPAPDLTIDSTADLDRLAPRAPVNIILLDEFNTLFEDMAFARYSLQKWLKSQPDKLTTPTMLVAVSLEKFQVLQDYTQNKDEILSALDHHFAAYPWQAQNFAWLSERYSTAFLTLRRVAEASEGHVGHKNMIWIGRGLPNISARFTAFDRDRVHNAMQQTVNELRDARVTLYTIDPAGVMTDPGRYGEEARLFEPFGGEANFKELARATGGRNLFGRNDVDAEIGTSIRDGASFYTLTYRPTNNQRDVNHFRKIAVSVLGRSDLKVITRQGYFDSRAAARLTSDGQASRRLATELVGAETSNMTYDAVPITVYSSSTPNRYLLHVENRSLDWAPSDGTTRRQTKLIITITTFDKKDKVVKSDARALTLNAGANAPPTGPIEGALNLACEVPPDSKAVRARFVVRVDRNGHMGTADVDFLHPPPPETPAAPAQP